MKAIPCGYTVIPHKYVFIIITFLTTVLSDRQYPLLTEET